MTAVRGVEEWRDIVPYLLDVDGATANLATGMPLARPALRAAVRRAYAEALARPDVDRRLGEYHGVRGDAVLRARIAALYRDRFGLPVTEAEVLVVPGAQAAFHALSELLARRGRAALLFGPEYPGYRTSTQVDYRMVPSRVCEVGPREFRYLPPAGAVDREIGAVFLSRPGNPAGTVVDDDVLAGLVRECAAADALLVLDNAYAPPIPGLAFRELGLPWGDNVVLVQSFAKAGLAGERLGFVLAPAPIVAELAEVQARVATFPPQLVQVVAATLLADGRFVELCATELRAAYRERHELVDAVLADRLTVPYRTHTADGGQFRWLHLPELRTTTGELFHELADRGVLVAPSAPFFLPRLRDLPHARASLRLGVTAPPAAIERGLTILAEVLADGR
ncbi:valine-pyruvate aminotransferase apoenzyme [Amycolatopsis arida]|uniref:Valine-pyruvate aminotransferase apoenzyme n=1 Tax=Amycolatopsis arida TaxID=587909 RepID=A0A1I6AKZ3_9PSEU|nr:aminotransferase class I/II-fold pyridoxal phosphate-dependent enzyme [Amycolatopsis arida]TDX87351.1 valine-pyruvate aminotransferase [Amycolatopsis arida]SFQ69197.1 valine-pyruvate aminotransferase apoenzyme [Amycolatopsis arida]